MSKDSTRTWAVIGVVVGAGALVVAILTFLENRPSSASDRAPYIATVDGLCSGALGQIRILGRPPLEDPIAYGEYTLAASQVNNILLTQWAQVIPPEQDIDTVRAMLDLQEEIVFRTGEVGGLLSGGEREVTSPMISQIQEDQLSLRQQTRAYGFQVCSRLMG